MWCSLGGHLDMKRDVMSAGEYVPINVHEEEFVLILSAYTFFVSAIIKSAQTLNFYYHVNATINYVS